MTELVLSSIYCLLALLIITMVSLFPARANNANSLTSSVLDPVFGSSGSMPFVRKLVFGMFCALVVLNLVLIIVGKIAWTNI